MRTWRSRHLPAVCCLGFLLAAGCRARGPSADAVASFRGGEVTRAELTAAASSRSTTAPTTTPGSPGADWRADLAGALAVQKLLAPEVSPSDPRVKQKLADARKLILANALAAELGWDKLTVTDAEVRAQYDSHPEQYEDPEKIRFQHIFFRAEASDMTPQERALVRTRLENLRKDIAAGADFGAMAKEYSQSEDAPSGGWTSVKAGMNVFPEFMRAIWRLKVDELGPVLDTPNGFHLVKVRDRIPPLDRKFEDVVEFARRRAQKAKLEAAQRAFVEEAGRRFGLVRNYPLLEDPLVKDDAPLIRVGQRTFTMHDLAERLPQKLSEHLYNGFFPSVHEYLDQVTLEELSLLEAERRGIPGRPEVVAKLERAELELRADAAFGDRLKKLVAAVPEKELREYYWQNKERYRTLRKVDIDLILLKPEPKEPLWSTLKRGDALVARLRSGEDFAELARKHSRHYSARDGGHMEGMTDMDIWARVQSTARFRRVLDALEPGEVSRPVIAECYDPNRLKFVETGVVIVRLDHRYPAEPQSFEKVRDAVADAYLRRNYQRLEAELRKQVLEAAAFRVYPERFPAL
jgi:peptidyl-prolyl cis-trans isomerase C